MNTQYWAVEIIMKKNNLYKYYFDLKDLWYKELRFIARDSSGFFFFFSIAVL